MNLGAAALSKGDAARPVNDAPPRAVLPRCPKRATGRAIYRRGDPWLQVGQKT